MLVIHVNVKVKPDSVQAFLEATVENARNSLQEAGIARFDVLQNTSDPTRFVFSEAYRNDEAPAAHKATAHYQKWRDRVADMMAEPRSSVQLTNAFPLDEGW
jgi:(4S)-4-hydroxy-5-phosphonooxypentane-2,3-dione isomerase